MDIDTYESLGGQVALVTGATRGIGAEIATALAERDALVYAGARNPDDITSPDLRPIELDVSADQSIANTVAKISDEAGRLDILVNNAGIAGPRDELDEISIESLDETLAVNLRGPILTTRAALSLLLQRPGGRVVNVSSGMGALGEGMRGGHPPYRIAKAGLNALTVYLHGAYASSGIIANAACPGWVRTDLGSPNAPKSPAEGAETPVWLSTFTPDAPGGRFWRDRRIIDW